MRHTSTSLRATGLLVAALSAGPPQASAAPTEPAPVLPYTLTGYVEGYYQWSFARPSNRITNLRGFDDRSNTFTLSNVVVDAVWDRDARARRRRVPVSRAHVPSLDLRGTSQHRRA